MIQKAKKRTSFFLGILVTSILGTIGGYVNSNYSKDGSFLVSVAKADVPSPFGGTGFEGGSAGESALGVDAGSGGGSGCDGGSGGSGDGGGSGGDCG
ncbi:MAG: hypothetical protein WC724_03450 [Candidatus Paceibacterota bacterium]|jgi:hypothetical protein